MLIEIKFYLIKINATKSEQNIYPIRIESMILIILHSVLCHVLKSICNKYL